jgi:hypothetical protein
LDRAVHLQQKFRADVADHNRLARLDREHRLVLLRRHSLRARRFFAEGEKSPQRVAKSRQRLNLFLLDAHEFRSIAWSMQIREYVWSALVDCERLACSHDRAV